MEGIALSAVFGAASAGVILVGALLALGKNVITKKEHTEICASNQAPIKVEIGHLKEGQERVEGKVDEILKVVYKLNGGKT